MRSTFTSRIRITRRGKVMRRKMGSSHFRSKKSAAAKQSRRKTHGLDFSIKAMNKRVRN